MLVRLNNINNQQRLKRISELRKLRKCKTPEENIALVKGGTYKGVSYRNRINLRRKGKIYK